MAIVFSIGSASVHHRFTIAITFVQDGARPSPHHHSMRSLLSPCAMLCGLALAGCATAAGARTPANSEAVLRTQTQALLDAVTAGDSRVWDRYVYLSEAGEIETKAQLLDEVKPLPAGISGKIELGRFEVRQFGDTAIVLHVDEESENYFGHQLHAQYLNTATWRLGPGGWRLISQQVLASLLDPPAIALPADQLDEYVGTYQLTDAISYTIRRDGDQLVGQRDSRPPQMLKVEARDVLFVPGQPRSRKIFLRDGAGKVTRFADRREARDVVWLRRDPPLRPR
jgi:hypothetical protein